MRFLWRFAPAYPKCRFFRGDESRYRYAGIAVHYFYFVCFLVVRVGVDAVYEHWGKIAHRFLALP